MWQWFARGNIQQTSFIPKQNTICPSDSCCSIWEMELPVLYIVNIQYAYVTKKHYRLHKSVWITVVIVLSRYPVLQLERVSNHKSHSLVQLASIHHLCAWELWLSIPSIHQRDTCTHAPIDCWQSKLHVQHFSPSPFPLATPVYDRTVPC